MTRVLLLVLVFSFFSYSLTQSSPCNRTSVPSCWIYGNHYDNSSYEVCAQGGKNCLFAPAQPIDDEENTPTVKWLLTQNPDNITAFIIPGLTDIHTKVPIRMSDDEHSRLTHVADLYAHINEGGKDQVIIIPTGGNAHPSNPRTPYNEAFQMKQVLFREYGIPAERIIIDSYALHTTTNLRNTARFLMQIGIKQATIVASVLQTAYIQHYDISGFKARCIKSFGYWVGDISPLTVTTTLFKPSPDCWKRGTDLPDP